MPIRMLFLADSHIGLDLRLRPRVKRRRRGEDFLKNHAKALQPALDGEADVVIHGGDVFDMPRIDRAVAHQAYAPLLRVAERGIPVFIVPGNHERSVLPHADLLHHARIHVFDRPRTFVVTVKGVTLALSGFPYARRGVRYRFPELVRATEWRNTTADVRLLLVHHCMEGATVGPADFTFTTAPDVIRHIDVPAEFSAVLSGHIHRQQVITRNLEGRPLRTPVIYPGSVERTAAAEIGEAKGYYMLRLHADNRTEWESRPLYARPLIVKDVDARRMTQESLREVVAEIIASSPSDAVVRVRLRNVTAPLMSAASLRRLAPETMNVELRLADRAQFRPLVSAATLPPQQLDLGIL